MANKTSTSWNDVEARNRGIDRGVPAHGQEHVERGARLDAAIQKAQAARREQLAARPAENPSANPLPSLKNAPKAAVPPFFKK